MEKQSVRLKGTGVSVDEEAMDDVFESARTAVSLAEYNAIQKNPTTVKVSKVHFKWVVTLSWHFKDYLAIMRLTRVKDDADLAFARELRNDGYRDVPSESDTDRGGFRKKGPSEIDKALRKKKEKYRKIDGDDDEDTDNDEEVSVHREPKGTRSTKSKAEETKKKATSSEDDRAIEEEAE
ncbi:hypothetical protein MMC18_006467 [Xylographa bjoerkii]|nr:hypothetical protein [Xylographa bjoerkii]